jgi:hypothetical protein
MMDRTVIQPQSQQFSQQGAAKGKPAVVWGMLWQQLKPSMDVAEHMANLLWLVRTRVVLGLLLFLAYGPPTSPLHNQHSLRVSAMQRTRF